jgi:tetratricopeptide (TPR) repeat protein/CHAT domain-containing protein
MVTRLGAVALCWLAAACVALSVVLAPQGVGVRSQEKGGPALTPAEKALAKEAERLHAEGGRLYQAGKLGEALRKMEEAYRTLQKLYPPGRYKEGHPHLAISLRDLGLLLREQGEHGKALPYLEQALAMCQKLYPRAKHKDGHPQLAAALSNLGALLLEQEEHARARPYLEQAVVMYRKLYPRETHKNGHPGLAIGLGDLGVLLREQGEHDKALPYLEQALAMCQKLYPPETHRDGHPDLATSLSNLGLLLQKQAKYDKALPYLQQALAMYRKLYPPPKYKDGHPDLAAGLHHLGELLREQGDYGKALPYHRQALAMYRKLYPLAKYRDGHPDLATSLNNVGAVLREQREHGKALPYFEQALAMCQKLYPAAKYKDGHPQLAGTLNNLGALLRERGDYSKALPYLQQALAMRQRLYPPAKYPSGHPLLATSLNDLGGLLRTLGEHGKALPYLEQALAMRQKLCSSATHKAGHPDLATSLNDLGLLLWEQGEHGKALPSFERALAMCQKLYPAAKHKQGHRQLAGIRSNLGGLLQEQGKYGKALPHLQQAVAMYRTLYPPEKYKDGHPDLAAGLTGLGLLHQRRGEQDKALPHLQQALAMCQKLYPAEKYKQGHPQLAVSLGNWGHLLQTQGEHGKALPYLQQAVAMHHQWLNGVVGSASEAEGLALATTIPRAHDGLLWATAHRPEADALTYDRLWASKAFLTRLLRRRHLAARVARAGPADLRAKWQELLDVRGQLSRLAYEPVTDLADRDRQLEKLTDRKEELERDLAKKLPEVERHKELDRLGPADLVKLLPAGTAFVDYVLYYRYTKGKEADWAYAAFVLAPGRPVRRVELGRAEPTEAAVAAWRRAIDGRKEDGRAAAALTKRVWAKVAAQLPPGTRTVYLAPVGGLARLPWAALPGSRPDRVLLEELVGGLAVVPHGPFLLEQLKYPPRYPAGPESVLALGGVAYDPPGATPSGLGYRFLKGTVAELRQAQALAGKRKVVVLEGDKASVEAVLKGLPAVRYAHLATHGFFAEKELIEERRRVAAQRKAWELAPHQTTQRIGLGARSPLLYTGLVLAGANRRGKAGPGESIITGEVLVGLPLEGLRLAVLSACETGLGELTGGEGVQGLQGAFHLAGCPNVVTSLWNVNDKATAALMAKFYHELWANKRPPLEALREAQLTIYRRPDLIPDLAGDRGAPQLKKAVELPVPAPKGPPGSRGKADTKLWAAFVLSGPGR